MAWLQLETNIGGRAPESFETLLEGLGAIAITLKDAGNHPLLEPAPGETPVWPEMILTALFPGDTKEAHIRAAFDRQTQPAKIEFTQVEDQDWQARFKGDLRPRQFGQRLWITPNKSHELPDASASVVLSPGLAFGTGDHPTTAMCLSWLDSIDLQGARVLDYGCGSGVLGLAAVALGARSACLTDIDPQALRAATDNALRNGLAGRISIAPPDKTDNSVRFDILVANILSGTLIELGPVLDRLMAPGARMAITGILARQADDVASTWSGWANMTVGDQAEDWVLLTGTKRGTCDSETDN
jgi:ribosomal protein L11 methyltransferase